MVIQFMDEVKTRHAPYIKNQVGKSKLKLGMWII